MLSPSSCSKASSLKGQHSAAQTAAMERPIIEELDADEQPGPYDAQLDQILRDKRSDAYAFLSATFEFLKRKTAFFEREDASKQLARLLKEVKPKPAASKAVPNGSAAKPSTPAPVSSLRPRWQIMLN